MQIPGYIFHSKVRSTAGGGVAIIMHQDISKQATVKNDSPHEVLWLKLKTEDSFLNIGIYYGKQENASNETVTNEFQSLSQYIMQMQLQQEHVILVGDFNAKILNPETSQIYNNDNKMSRNGRIMHNFIEDTNLNVMNSSTKCEGKWTWTSRNKKSIIDYVLMSTEAAGYTNKIIIDEEGSLKPNGKNQTDHNSILIDVSIPVQRITPPTKKIWKINNNTNWEMYQEYLTQTHITTNKSQQANVTNQHQALVKQLTNAALQSIGQITIKPNKKDPVLHNSEVKNAKLIRKTAKEGYQKAIQSKNSDTIKSSLDLYIKAQMDTKEIIKQKHTEVFEEKLDKLAKCGGTNSKIFWNLIRKIRKPNAEDILPVETEDGVTLYEESEILEYTAAYYEKLYTIQNSKAFSHQWLCHIQSQVLNKFDNMQYDHLQINKNITTKLLQ